MKHVSTTKINDSPYNGSIDVLFFCQRWFVNAPYGRRPPCKAASCYTALLIVGKSIYTYLLNHIRSNTKKMHIYHLVLENDNIYNNHILSM